MKRTLSFLLVLIIIMSLALSACTTTPDEPKDDGVTDEIIYVEMDFGSYGKIVLKLDAKEAPITVSNFVKLVNDGFYDGLTIFRAQRNFVIQGGKDDSVNLTPIEGEFSANGHENNISHKRGTISMARTSDPNSATSQFFITLHDSAVSSLDGKYAAFGKVIEGMDVVDKIAEAILKCESDSMGFVSDADAIKIVSAKVIEYNEKEESNNGGTSETEKDEPKEDMTDVMGIGACEYLETRDTEGRDVKYVEMCIEGYGRLVILLDATTAPETVANFVSLVESGFYDGLTFHRIIQDFMIQGGDPKGDGTGGNEDENGNEINIKGEFSSNGHENDISHKYGVISMARASDPNSASSQFFICNADASSSLDGSYAAFGYVVEGMSVIDELTKDVFPKTDYADYYGNFEYDSYFGTYKHIVWQYLGNGVISNKNSQPVIKYVKLLDSWSSEK